MSSYLQIDGFRVRLTLILIIFNWWVALKLGAVQLENLVFCCSSRNSSSIVGLQKLQNIQVWEKQPRYMIPRKNKYWSWFKLLAGLWKTVSLYTSRLEVSISTAGHTCRVVLLSRSKKWVQGKRPFPFEETWDSQNPAFVTLWKFSKVLQYLVCLKSKWIDANKKLQVNWLCQIPENSTLTALISATFSSLSNGKFETTRSVLWHLQTSLRVTRAQSSSLVLGLPQKQVDWWKHIQMQPGMQFLKIQPCKPQPLQHFIQFSNKYFKRFVAHCSKLEASKSILSQQTLRTTRA